jgi:uncharacterized membrane protein
LAPSSPAKKGSQYEKDRVEALSDGIFGTVMTILVLSLVVPAILGPNIEATLEADLVDLFPDILAYIITFIFLGVLWISHQNMFSHIEKITLTVLWINILLLLSIGLTPFSTALLGRYPMAPIAVFVYGLNALVVSILFNILWFYPRLQRLTHEEPRAEMIAKRSKIALVGPIIYTIAVIFSFVEPVVSLGCFAFVTIFYLIFGGRYIH